jgi:transcription initiation factor TFIIIB Brf1 subunit/transcription initiation factor TFIIB
MTRVNPLDDLTDFATKPAGYRQGKSVPREVIDRIATDNNFPSRQPVAPAVPAVKQQRRYVTGRNQQINIKATGETIEKLQRIAEELGVPYGEVLDKALDALETASR